MLYLDTSIMVPLFVLEARSAAVLAWYRHEAREMATTTWSIPEFASALGIKQRTGMLDATQARSAWARFERFVAADLRLLPVESAQFHRAAALVLDAASALRSGDALHLACAEAAGATHMATLDDVLARNARRIQIEPVIPRPAA